MQREKGHFCKNMEIDFEWELFYTGSVMGETNYFVVQRTMVQVVNITVCDDY